MEQPPTISLSEKDELRKIELPAAADPTSFLYEPQHDM